MLPFVPSVRDTSPVSVFYLFEPGERDVLSKLLTVTTNLLFYLPQPASTMMGFGVEPVR